MVEGSGSWSTARSARTRRESGLSAREEERMAASVRERNETNEGKLSVGIDFG